MGVGGWGREVAVLRRVVVLSPLSSGQVFLVPRVSRVLLSPSAFALVTHVTAWASIRGTAGTKTQGAGAPL